MTTPDPTGAAAPTTDEVCPECGGRLYYLSTGEGVCDPCSAPPEAAPTLEEPEAVRASDEELIRQLGEAMAAADARFGQVLVGYAFLREIRDALASQAARIATLEERAATAENEVMEQARLNGMGSEREARLLARVAALEAERDRLREVLREIAFPPAYPSTGAQPAMVAARRALSAPTPEEATQPPCFVCGQQHATFAEWFNHRCPGTPPTPEEGGSDGNG